MTRRIIAFLFAAAVAGGLCAGTLTVDVKTYDFSSIVVTGQGTGTASLAVDGSVVATKAVAGDFELVARGLTPGRVYAYEVTLGEDTAQGEVTMGMPTGAVFGANATTGVGRTQGGDWSAVSPYAPPAVTASAYDLQGARTLFGVTTGLDSKIAYVDSTMTFLDGMDELDPSLSAIGAFTLAQTNAASVTDFFWAGLVGGENRWMSLEGLTPEPGTYVSRMEFDLNDAAAVKVRYSLKRADGDAPFVALSCEGAEWFPVATDAFRIAAVSYEGTGRLAAFEGSTLSVDLAEADGVRYPSLDAALAAAGTNTVKLLWDCTWMPCLRGRWTLTPDGRTLVVESSEGWAAEYDGTVLCASNVKVARVGSAEYYFLQKAFAAEGETVTLLTNTVENGDIAFTGAKTLDLAGRYVSGAGRLVPSGEASLAVTNSTSESGGFAMGLGEGLAVTVWGGRWPSDAGTLGAGYRFFELADPVTVDGVAYAYEAVATTEERPAKAYAMSVADSGETNSVIVADEFVANNVEGAAAMTAAELTAALNAPRSAGNGLPLVQCYVLGLDPSDAASKPVVVPVQTAEANTVGVALGNVSVNAKAGVKVAFSLTTATNPDFDDAVTTAQQDTPSFVADVPSTGEPNVRYYRINVLFGR